MLFNNFVEFKVGEQPTECDYELYLTQDILSMRQILPEAGGFSEEDGALRIYLGWYPDGEPDGSYRIDLHRKGADERFNFFEHRNFTDIRKALELCLSLGARYAGNDEIERALMNLNS